MKKSLTKLVKHPKWCWSKGMLAHPPYKESQQVRVLSTESFEGWLPVLSDDVTIARLTLMLIEAGGEVRYDGNSYLVNNNLKAKDLSEIICEGLCQTWGVRP